MGVPKQVEEAAAAAEEYLESLETSEADESTDTDDTASEDEVETNDESEDSADVNNDEPEDTDDADEAELYKNKYLTLKGKYDAEVPTLHTELKELKENIFGKIEELSKSNASQDAEETPEADDFEENFREEFGDDLINFIDKYIQKKIKPQLEEAVKPVEQKVQSVEDSQIASAKDEFAQYLTDNVKGDWESAKDDPAFIEFLQKPEPSGLYTYGDLMAMYNENWDHEKMAKVFNIYYGDGEKAPKEESKPKSEPPQKEAIVAPSRQTQHNVPEPTDGKIWTEESMNQFYKDDRAGKFSPEESVQLWDDLLSAAAEGRIH